MSHGSLQMEDGLNQSRGGQILPLQEENLQNLFIKEPKSSSQGREAEITDNYLFKKPDDENAPRDSGRQVKPFDAKGPALGEKEQLSFGAQRMSDR